MTYEDFIQHLTKNVMHEARYQDSEGRSILVICVADAYDMVMDAIKEEREACVKAVETLMTPGHDDNNKWFNNGVLLSTVKIKEREK